MKTKGVSVLKSEKKGPTLAVFAGVHGNERAGVYAIEQLSSELQITKGTVFLVLANLPAIEANTRMINKNLNRCFQQDNKGDAPEDRRARELMKILDKCDALLDLHMFYDDYGKPFAICEKDSIDVAKIFDVEVISTNWSKVEPGGTDGYMFERGKVGICLECGPISKSEEYTEFAKISVNQFLRYYGVVDKDVEYSKTKKRIIKAEKAIFKDNKSYVLEPGFKNFQLLTKGQLIASDETSQYYAEENQCIIFPHYNARVNEESYILGKYRGLLR